MHKRQKDRLIYTTLIILCIVGFWLFDNFYTPASYSSGASGSERSEIPDYIIPSSSEGAVVKHDHYWLSYLEKYEQAEWVVYVLHPEHLTSDDRIRPDFIEDPFVKTKSADWRNYRGSGYDRGHLCPAGDRRFSELAYKETFYTSNISPQNRDFNAGIWNELEKQVRYWARTYGSLYVTTGGVLHPGLRAIGDEDVAVPEAYYKIVAKGEGQDLEVICFLIPHIPSEEPLERYLVPVDEVERQTGIDFFKGLPDNEQEELEKAVSSNTWTFRAIH